MRFVSSLILIFCLAGCQHGAQSSDAVRQGVIDHLSKTGYNVSGMDIAVAAVKFNGEQADATVNITAKGQTSGTPMTFGYHLEHQNNKWTVVGPPAAVGHGGAADPNAGGANPHGGGLPPAASGTDNPHGAMPSPQDLPPAKKK